LIYVIWRPRSPTITLRIIDPYLLVYWQSHAAYHPQFIVQNKPVITLACASCCWQYRYGTPRVRRWVVSVLRAWRSAASYHVDFTIEQYTCHVALDSRHGRSCSVAVRTGVINENRVGSGGERCGVTADDVHHAAKSCCRHTAACSGHSHSATPGPG